MPAPNAAAVLRFLHPDLCATLASLHGAPRSVAEATIQLLPFGSRAALEATDPPLAVAAGGHGDESRDHRPLALTPFAYEVMAHAAAAADADPAGVEEWSRRAQRAAKAVAEKAARRP